MRGVSLWLKPIRAAVIFSVFYLVELVRANLRIARDVATPGLRIQPGFLAIPLKVHTDFQLLLFSNLVSMTPGTLTLDVSPDRKHLYIHAMYVDDLESLRHQIGDQLQEKILEVFA